MSAVVAMNLHGQTAGLLRAVQSALAKANVSIY